jgi:hypothetical protein
MSTWSLLVATIPHRHEYLCGLLRELDRQAQPGFNVIAYRTRALASQRPEAQLARKMQVLLETSTGEYVSHMDDDDVPAPDFVPAIMEALEGKPDYVGFRVHYTVDGAPQQQVFHSLQHQGWSNHPGVLLRDISHLNPMRRELAVQARFDNKPDHGADGAWAAELRAKGIVKTEVYIDQPMYHYDFRSGQSFLTRKQPWPYARLPERPQYPWLSWIGE